jgi:hypothetical protein
MASGMDVATSSSVGDPVAGSAEAEASESDFDIDIDAEDLIPGDEAMPKRLCLMCFMGDLDDLHGFSQKCPFYHRNKLKKNQGFTSIFRAFSGI